MNNLTPSPDVANLTGRESPDHVFVRFYPGRLRRIVREKRLTPSLLGWLIIVAARINEDRTCWPGVDKIAEDMQVSVRCTQVALRKLRKLGILTLVSSPTRTNGYGLPDAFSYGNGRGDQKITPEDDLMITPETIIRSPNPLIKRSPKEDPCKAEPKKTNQAEAMPPETQSGGELPPGGRPYDPRAEAEFKLLYIGYRADTARQILLQYEITEIEETFNKIARKREAGQRVQNDAGLFRKILEEDTGRKLKPAAEFIKSKIASTAQKLGSNGKSKIFGDGQPVDALSGTPLGKTRA